MREIQLLKQYFGYDSFRQGQETLISAVLGGSDVVGIMPTGAGKSICYQIPAMMLDGLTLVISPLISLMQDQVKSLIQVGIPAAYINSTLSPKQMHMALDNAKAGKYKMIYLAPERLETPEFLDFAESVEISMVSIDEAHCISQWGQDFRPSYLQIPNFINAMENRPIVSAFTATATKKVEQDIIASLHLQDPVVLVTGFDRENLYFEVQKPKKKMDALIGFLEEYKNKNGIIYCTSRKNVETVCQTLLDTGYGATRYHAGLSDRERRENQEDFLFDRVAIMVATNAFGMGIDKSNVSFVVHYNMPKDLESYYQEAGRAGRDGTVAKCLMLYSGQDVRTNQWMIEHGQDGPRGDEEEENRLKEQQYKRLREMTFYATTNHCLRSFILKYFGETPPPFCGFCGNCDTKFDTIDGTIDAKKILSCIHRMKSGFGIGMVIDVLRGVSNQRIVDLGFDTLSTYDICEKSSATLRVIIEHLLQGGYLKQSIGEYPVLQLTEKSNLILRENETIIVQLPQEKTEQEKGKSVKVRGNNELPSHRNDLYERLKAITGTIAKDQKVPPFMIFSNGSLIDMCLRLPKTEAEFKEVSGVGTVKLKRYGADFMEEITQYCLENPSDALTSNGEKTSKKGKRKSTAEMVIPSEEMIQEIEITSKPTSISFLKDRINDVMQQHQCTQITSVNLGDWLVMEGYLQVERQGTHTTKVPTKFGFDSGILQEEKIRGENKFFVNMYPKDIQKQVVDHIIDIINNKQSAK